MDAEPNDSPLTCGAFVTFWLASKGYIPWTAKGRRLGLVKQLWMCQPFA
jgi:hypothetical protein